ncbi:3751_t:CDS:1, partial [Cetraspora pellucida]
HSDIIKLSSIETSDIVNSDDVNSSNKITNEIKNEFANENNSEETKDNEGCDSYISEAEFWEYLQKWAEILDEEEKTSITQDQDDTIELDDSIHPAIDENAK